MRLPSAPNVTALAQKAAQALPRFERGGEVDLAALTPTERREVISTVAKEAKLEPGAVADQLLALWGGATMDSGLRAQRVTQSHTLRSRDVGLGGHKQLSAPGVFSGLGIAMAVKGQSVGASALKGTAWENVGADYAPKHVKTPQVVRDNDRTIKPGGWADPEVVSRAELSQRMTHETGGKVLFDNAGKPLNPAGPTGKTGRVLGKWGPNHAADPVIIRRNPDTGVHEMLAIKRKDTGAWAIPGGMTDAGERISGTLARELAEETGAKLDMSDAVPVYQGVVKADPRNTDNSWMETNVCLKVLNEQEAGALTLQSGDDASDVRWMPLTAENIGNLYASHGDFVQASLDVMAQRDVALRRTGAAEAVATLAPELQGLPEPLQQLCVELDGLWGNADGKVSVAELDRVAQYTLQALPFFTSEAEAIVELAATLGYCDKMDAVPELQRGLKKLDASVDPETKAKRKKYRALLDTAIASSDVNGAELIRDVAMHAPRWHRLSILEHTAAAVAGIHALSKVADIDWPASGAVMLLHDIGKITDRQKSETAEGQSDWHFHDHEEMGALWLEQHDLDPALIFHVRHHGDIRHNSIDEIVDTCGGDVRKMQEFLLVGLADALAKGDTPSLKDSFEQLQPKFRELAQRCGVDADPLIDAYYALRADWFSAA